MIVTVLVYIVYHIASKDAKKPQYMHLPGIILSCVGGHRSFSQKTNCYIL